MIDANEARQIVLDLARYWDFTMADFVRLGGLSERRVLAIMDGGPIASIAERKLIEKLWQNTPITGGGGCGTRRWCPEPPPSWDNIIRAYEERQPIIL